MKKLDTDKYLHISFNDADCYAFGSILYKDYFGYELPSFQYEIENIRSMVKAVSDGRKQTFKSVEKSDLQYLDGIIFSSKECGRHIGYYLGNGLFIHQTRSDGAVIERLNSIKWKNRTLGFCRYEP